MSTMLRVLLLGLLALVGACQKTPTPSNSSEAGHYASDGAGAKIKRENTVESKLQPGKRFPTASMAPSQVLTTDPAQVALSPEEALWLRQHGFLTQKEIDSVESLSSSELEGRMRNNADARAATLLGVRRMRDGDGDGAVIALDRAARSGSLYAVEQLASAELQSATGYRPGHEVAIPPQIQALFVARMEQARFLGDHRVDFYINRIAGSLDRRQYGDMILKSAGEYVRQLGEDAALRRRAAPGPDARPNIDQWQQLGSGGRTQVPVFVPGG